MNAVNLLPTDQRGGFAPVPVAAAGEPAGGSGAYVVLVALALCVVALAGYVLSGNAIRQHEADLAGLEARSAAVMAESARLRPYADFQSTAQTRIATVRDLATRRFDWERSLRDLARAVPEDVTVKSLGASISSQSGGGGTSSALRSALDVPAIQLEGCTVEQNAVARLMARLRNVQGVSRVSLQSSVKPAKTESTVVADSASDAEPTGCDVSNGKTPPDFTVVIFFEGEAAAAAAPGTAAETPATGTGATGTAATGTETSAAPAATPEPTASSTTASTTTDGVK
jgi:Tfp pilus assembly protein PilN